MDAGDNPPVGNLAFSRSVSGRCLPNSSMPRSIISLRRESGLTLTGASLGPLDNAAEYGVMLSRPDAVYGQHIGSNYQVQGLNSPGISKCGRLSTARHLATCTMLASVDNTIYRRVGFKGNLMFSASRSAGASL